MTQHKEAYFSHNMQYVKDLSFENPSFPLILNDLNPKITFDVDISSHQLEENEYEVTLDINCQAVQNNQTLFIVELKYAGLFTIQSDDEFLREFMIKVKAPEILFPFARRVIADVTRDGGLPPLLLTPIDFESRFEDSRLDESRLDEASEKLNHNDNENLTN